MKQDIYNSYINTLLAYIPLEGAEVLEIGCGSGRITRDIARHARHVMAIDTDLNTLSRAREEISADNISFQAVEPEKLPFPHSSFDLVLYSLSLHHLPLHQMAEHLILATEVVRPDGVIAIIEPTDGGSFSFAKEYFGAGSGDERTGRDAARRAIRSLSGWRRSLPLLFDVTHHYDNAEDFIKFMLPHLSGETPEKQAELRSFLARHTEDGSLLLDATRILLMLRRSIQ